MSKTTKKPTPAQAKKARFAQEYLVDLNATKAAERAGYSPKTAYSAGSRLLKDVEVQALIAQGMAERSRRVEITQDRVLEELGRIGFYRLKDAFEDDGTRLKSPHQWPPDVAAAVLGLELAVDKAGDTVKKVRLSDRLRALELIGRHLKMFTDKVEHSGSIGLAGIDEESVKHLSDEELKAALGHARMAADIVRAKAGAAKRK